MTEYKKRCKGIQPMVGLVQAPQAPVMHHDDDDDDDDGDDDEN